MKRFVYSTETLGSFTTFELRDVDRILASSRIVNGAKRFISDLEHKQKFSDELFAFIDEAYDELGGFRSFKDMDRFINDSYLWYITYEGPQPPEDQLDVDRIYVVSVYRKNHGLKLVGIARRRIARQNLPRSANSEIRQKANAALAQHLKFMARRGWAEVSDSLERWCFKVLGDSYVINPEYLQEQKIFQNMVIDEYDDHYSRPLRKGGPLITKIAFGTIKEGKG